MTTKPTRSNAKAKDAHKIAMATDPRERRALKKLARQAAHGDRPYPESPGFKESTTSKGAAMFVARSAKAVRKCILDELAKASDGLTPDECAERLGVDVLTARPRFTELKATGKIERTGKLRASSRQRPSHVFRIAACRHPTSAE